MALFGKANCQAASLAFNMLGWLCTMTCMGMADWHIWYIENNPARPWGMACIGMWKVCTYYSNGLQGRPMACHRYNYSDTYLPLDIRIAQHLLLASSLLGLLGKGLMVMGLWRVYRGQLQKDITHHLFSASGVLSIIAGTFIFIALLWNYHAVMTEEGIHFPPSFNIPFRPDRQQIGNSVPLAVLAAFLVMFSGLLTISFQQPLKPKSTPNSRKYEVPGCIALQIHDEQFMGV